MEHASTRLDSRVIIPIKALGINAVKAGCASAGNTRATLSTWLIEAAHGLTGILHAPGASAQGLFICPTFSLIETSEASMQKVLYVIGALLVAALVILVEFHQWRMSMYKEMTTAQIVDVETSELLFLFFGVGLVLLIVLLLLGMMRGNRISIPTPRYDDGTVIDVTPRPAQMHVPSPRYVNVPRLSTNNQARPIGAKPAPTILTTQYENTQGQSANLQVPLEKLFKLAACATPTRAEWKREHGGGNDAYTAALGFFRAHGFLTSEGKWREEYSREARESWLEQFEE
jgi:hypothetical protein